MSSEDSVYFVGVAAAVDESQWEHALQAQASVTFITLIQVQQKTNGFP